MPKGKPTPAEVQADIVDAVLHQGIPMKQVAMDMHVHPQTVSNIVKRYQLMEQHEGERMQKETIVAGNKKSGQLVQITDKQDTYRGTCRRGNGKFDSKRFTGMPFDEAKAAWEKWCEELRAQDAPEPEPFAKEASVQMVHEELIATPECKDVSDRLPIRKGMTPKEVASMLRDGVGTAEKVCMDTVAWECLLTYIEGLTLPVPVAEVRNNAPVDADMTDFVNEVCESDIPLYALSELRSDADVRVSRDAWNRLADRALDLATERADGLPEEMYVTWMADKGPHALFSDMETATKTFDTLNSALEFAGIDKRYEVMDVRPWKG